MKTEVATLTWFIIRIRIHAVRFHFNLSGKSVYDVVPDERATRFSSKTEADAMAHQHGLRPGQFVVETI